MESLFSQDVLHRLFPPERADQFFEALFGDPSEGAYDIALVYDGYDQEQGQLRFAFELRERPGKCLACNLTHGLPEVFSRHPLIDLPGLVSGIDTLLEERANCREWRLGPTHQADDSLHRIPLLISLG